eukprot:4502960-Prorocentrum_lima.AAC.1
MLAQVHSHLDAVSAQNAHLVVCARAFVWVGAPCAYAIGRAQPCCSARGRSCSSSCGRLCRSPRGCS